MICSAGQDNEELHKGMAWLGFPSPVAQALGWLLQLTSIVQFLHFHSLCLLVEQIEAIHAALIGQDLLPLHPALAKPACLPNARKFGRNRCVFTHVLCNLMGSLLEKGKSLAWAPWGLKTKIATSSAVETFSAFLWTCGLQYVTSHTVEKYSNTHWGCVIFLDFGTHFFSEEVVRLKAHVVFDTCGSACGQKTWSPAKNTLLCGLFWPVCLEMLETKPVKGNFVKEPVKTFYVKKPIKVLFSGIMKTQVVYKFMFWHKKGKHL